jgi:hypothetical protein
MGGEVRTRTVGGGDQVTFTYLQASYHIVGLLLYEREMNDDDDAVQE